MRRLRTSSTRSPTSRRVSSSTFTDNGALDGFNTYIITAYSGDEAGEPAEHRAYIGFDIPGMPKDVRATSGLDAITVDWKAPSTLGVNGGYVEPDELTYNIYTLDLEALDFVILKEGVKGLSYQPQVPMYGVQDLHYFAVSGVSDVGEGEYEASNLVISGAPYTLPFRESFRKGNLDNSLWWVDTDDCFWPKSYNSADDIIGSADWTPKEKGTVASFNSGKISLKGAANPVLRFWHNGVPGLNYHLRLEVMTPDNKTVELKDIDYSKLTGDRQWIEEVVDLGDYAAYDFIVLKFLGECNDKELQRLSFDAVEIYDVLGHNLCAVSTKPTLTGTVGNVMEAGVTVRNIGENVEDNFTIDLYLNGRKVASQKGGPLDPFRSETYYLNFTPKRWRMQASVRSMLPYSPPARMMIPATTQRRKSTSTSRSRSCPPSPTCRLSARATTSTWPAKPTNTSRTVVEDFESYLAWSNGEKIGDWKTVDGDKLPTIGISGFLFPHCGDPMAYIIFDPVEMGLSSLPRFVAHSGTQYISLGYLQ